MGTPSGLGGLTGGRLLFVVFALPPGSKPRPPGSKPPGSKPARIEAGTPSATLLIARRSKQHGADLLMDAGHHAGLVFPLRPRRRPSHHRHRQFSDWPWSLLSQVHAAAAVVRAVFAHRCAAFIPDTDLVVVLAVALLRKLCQHKLLPQEQRQLCGASWVRAPGVPRPHSRGLLPLLDLLQQR